LNYGFYQSAGFIFAEGGQLFDNTQKCVLDQGTGTVDAMKWLLTAYKAPGVKSDTNGSNLDALFKAGTVAMIFNGEWATGDYVKALGADKVAIAPPITMMPSGKPFAPFLGTKNIFLSANSKGDAKNAAIKFLTYMSLPETQALFAKVGHIPTNSNVPVTDPITLGFIKQSQTSTYFPNEPEMGAVWTPAGDMITKILTNSADPTTTVADTAKTINTANNK
jgi:arabinogalactan oligomer/maltooligosaccharide transport system substrate-binding protein